MALNSKNFWQDFGPDEDGRVFLVAEGMEQRYAEVFANGDALFRGLGRGIVAILCDKSVAAVTAYFGALRNGQVPLMLDAEAKPAALDRIFDAYSPDCVFDPKGGVWPGYEVKSALEGGGSLYTSRTSHEAKPHSDLAVLLGTSGSTGDPKFVRLSYNSLDACAQSVCEYLDLDPTRRGISLLPFHYSYGLSVLNTVAARRASFVITEMSVLDRDLWRLMAELRVTDLSGVPFMFEMVNRMRLPDEVMATLKCVTQAGGRLDPKVTGMLREKFSAAGVRYFTMYGQTEASPRISYLAPERAVEKEGSVGVPISCGQALIAETGTPSGEGELLYKGANVALGYARSREDISLGDEFGGQLFTGDHVRIDAEGYIYIIGRRKRFVKLQGVSVNLDHVEAVLRGQGNDCLVVGRENLVVICYVDLDRTAISRVVGENFTFHPSNIRLQQVDSLPMNANGKPDYALISDEFL